MPGSLVNCWKLASYSSRVGAVFIAGLVGALLEGRSDGKDYERLAPPQRIFIPRDCVAIQTDGMREKRRSIITRFVLVTRPGDVSSLSYLLDFVKRPHTLFGTCVQKQRTSSTSCDNGVMSSAAGVARFRES